MLAYKSGFCHHTNILLLSFGSVLSFRMPAILDGDEAIRKWLDFAEVPTQEAVKLIQPVENIVFHPVSTFVNNIHNNTPECVAPIELGAKKVGAGGGLAAGSSATMMSLSQVRAARLQGVAVGNVCRVCPFLMLEC